MEEKIITVQLKETEANLVLTALYNEMKQHADLWRNINILEVCNRIQDQLKSLQ